MSQLKLKNITHISNTGDPNIVLGDSGDTQVQSLNSGPLAGFRNQIINGDFRIWQRGTSFPKDSSPASAHKYSADRWEANGTVADFYKAAAFGGFNWAIVVSSVTSGVAYIVQHVELDAVADYCQFVAGSTWTLSYWMRDNTSGAPSIDFRGDANGANQLLWTAVGAVQQIETTGVWKRYSRTFTAATYAQGQHDRATVYIPASSGANTLFTGVQLEPGPVATPFEHRPFGTELALCQRYYQKLNEVTGVGPVGLTQAQNTTRMVCFLPTKCTMRAAPSVGLPSTANFQLQVNDSVFGDIDFAVDQSCPSGVFVLAQPNAGNANRFTVGGSGRLFTLNASAGSFTADAEL